MSESETAKGNVAILGASNERRKFGNKSLRAHEQAGWNVYPVNPNESEVEGHRAFPRVTDVPVPVDRVTVYLPPETTLRVLTDVAAVAPREVWFNPGAANAAVLAEAERLGLPFHDACSIVDLGLSPSMFP